MTRWPHCFVVAIMLSLEAIAASACRRPGLDKIRAEYLASRAQLQNHLVDQQMWIDDDPQSPELLAKSWSLSHDWLAAWLDAHPAASAEEVKNAIRDLGQDAEQQSLKLADDAFLVTAPGRIGHVFIVARE